MVHTLRRSRSKYGRTRRQRRKQRRIRGGGIFDDIINKFKPASTQEKCEKAKQAAEEVCSSSSEPVVVEQQSGDDLSPPSELESLVPESQIQRPDSVAISESDMLSPPEPEPLLSEELAATSNPGMMPPPSINEPAGMMPPSSSEPAGMEQKYLAQTQQQPPPLPMQTVNFGGSRRKNKKKNKKQSRRKKMKSRKHKK